MADRADYLISKGDSYGVPVFRGFNRAHLGKPFPEESFNLYLRVDGDPLLEIFLPLARDLAPIKTMFFPNSTLYDEKDADRVSWHFVKLSDTDRMWFELAAE